MKARLFFTLCLAWAVAGCGGSARPGAAPSSAPAPEASEPGDSDGTGEGVREYQQQPGYAPGGGFAQPPGQSGSPPTGAGPSLRTALDSFEAAATRLSQAGADCRLACKALGSMRRSTQRICQLSDSEDSEHCQRAKRRLKDAEKRVESTCSCSETP